MAIVVEGDPKAPFFNGYNTKEKGKARLLFMDCFTLPLICSWWVLSKVAWSAIFWVFGMTQPGIELRASKPLVNTLPTSQIYTYNQLGYASFRYVSCVDCIFCKSAWNCTNETAFTLEFILLNFLEFNAFLIWEKTFLKGFVHSTIYIYIYIVRFMNMFALNNFFKKLSFLLNWSY